METEAGCSPTEATASIAERDYSGATHVHPKMREHLATEGRERITNAWAKVYVPTATTRDAFVALGDCMNAPPSVKPEGLVIYGKVDTGKSRTMEAFRDAHPPDPRAWMRNTPNIRRSTSRRRIARN